MTESTSTVELSLFARIKRRLARLSTDVAEISLVDWAKALALVIAGGWTLYEHVVAQTIARVNGEEFSWATSSIETDHAKRPDDSAVLHVRLKLENTSKRRFTPLFASWIVAVPGTPETYLATKNTTRIENVNPGEAAQDAVSFVLPHAPDAVIVRTKVYYHTSSRDSLCGLNPTAYPKIDNTDVAASQRLITAMDDVPRVCVLEPEHLWTPKHGSRSCLTRPINDEQVLAGITSAPASSPNSGPTVGCEYEFAEKMVNLTQE